MEKMHICCYFIVFLSPAFSKLFSIKLVIYVIYVCIEQVWDTSNKSLSTGGLSSYPSAHCGMFSSCRCHQTFTTIKVKHNLLLSVEAVFRPGQ